MSGLIQQEHLFSYGSPLVSDDEDEEEDICFDSNAGYTSSSDDLYTSDDGNTTEDEQKVAETALDNLPHSSCRYSSSSRDYEVSAFYYSLTLAQFAVSFILKRGKVHTCFNQRNGCSLT